ncbi:DUF4328 domain-containing protein [Haloactinomyces albus]|uniref:DUF4328 domain-containing protein n=1 Tax=Haloactinomyces albus TaxID=1352928 RepID=A0AAE3ZDJ9_9ACTN|nr:DUF4328 domain-containing protein [Haloactinomyces albus]MDR7301920.1 hypothetical protein [Haloactinomyces albus]
MTRRPTGSEAPVEWVATPPGGVRPPRVRSAPRRYTGPPSYSVVPRWGFPQLTWRWPLALPSRTRVDPAERVLSLSATAVSTLWVTAGLACVATIAEIWRYVLLLRSRNGALARTPLAFSDALVITAGVMTWVIGVLCGVVVVLWALRARAYAATQAGVRPARSDWQFVTGVLVPGPNLFVPGSALAELEHTVLMRDRARDPHARPRPTWLVQLWWCAWSASLLLGWITFLWGFTDGVQALANGVVLHAWTNAVMAALAIVTVYVVKYLTRLLVPVDTTEVPRLRVLGVRGAPAPPRQERPTGAPR